VFFILPFQHFLDDNSDSFSMNSKIKLSSAYPPSINILAVFSDSATYLLLQMTLKGMPFHLLLNFYKLMKVNKKLLKEDFLQLFFKS
jgi:hypothetical protein